MKKLLSAILVLTMVLSLGCAAFADGSQPTVSSTIKGIYDMIVEKKTQPVDSVMSILGSAYDVASGEATVQEKMAEVNVIPKHVQYKSVNDYEHYIQVLNSDGEVIVQNAEAHAYGLDGICAKCGHKFGGQDHIHTAAGLNYVALNSGFHEIQVVCACGEVISVEQYAHHNFDANGVCVDCGYGKKDEPAKDDPADEPANDDPAPVNPGPAKDPDPIKYKEGYYEGNLYEIYLFQPGTKDRSWKTAKALAESISGGDGTLVCITSQGEQDFLNLLNDKGYNLWIGAERVEKDWTWVTGEDWGFEYWGTGCPVADALNNYGAMCPYYWFNLVNEGTVDGKCIIDGFVIEYASGDYSPVLQENITAEQAKSEQTKTGDANVEITNVIAAETETAATPAWLYVVCAVAAMALAGGIVVIVASKKKA